MNRENLFRLALVTNSHAPQTLSKYIILLAKLVIVESSQASFSANTLSKLIKQRYDLEFSVGEIVHSLNFDEDFELDTQHKQYSLKPDGIQSFKDSKTKTNMLEDFLYDYINIFHKDAQDKEKYRIKELIMQYIYFSFNSGKKSLSSLLMQSVDTDISDDFTASETDKKIINTFLNWDNANKNECIYSIVSYCLDYGMLTSKKDIESYRKIFEGVHFYLDTNIIFRLVGMNNAERQEVIQHFVDKCKEVDIRLCYTNFTYQEIFIAINNAVKYVKYLNNGDKPLAPIDLEKLGEFDNKDFYEMYYNWCKEDLNRYDDYDAFQEFLKQKVSSCLEGFTKVDTISAEHSNLKSEFLSLSKGLMDYKNQRNYQRPCTIESAKTDVNNFLFIKYNTSENEKDTSNIKAFIISADRRFYDWAVSALPGVPVVFMPSEWLSIILKYTSRTDSDYNTFCKFLNLRNSYDAKQKDRAMQIIHSINELTSDVDVKSKVINQITEMTLSINEEEYEEESEIVRKAFDMVLENQKKEADLELNKKIEAQEVMYKRQLGELMTKANLDVESAKREASLQTTKNIAIDIADKKIRKWTWIKQNLILTDIIIGIVSFFILIAISKINFIEAKVIAFCDTSKLLKDNKFDFTLMLSGAISLVIILVVTIIVNFLSSEKRRLKIIEKEEKNIATC